MTVDIGVADVPLLAFIGAVAQIGLDFLFPHCLFGDESEKFPVFFVPVNLGHGFVNTFVVPLGSLIFLRMPQYSTLQDTYLPSFQIREVIGFPDMKLLKSHGGILNGLLHVFVVEYRGLLQRILLSVLRRLLLRCGNSGGYIRRGNCCGSALLRCTRRSSHRHRGGRYRGRRLLRRVKWVAVRTTWGGTLNPFPLFLYLILSLKKGTLCSDNGFPDTG